MATFEKQTRSDGTIRHRAKVRLRGYRGLSATFPKLSDAKGWANKRESEMRAGRYRYIEIAEKRIAAELIDQYMDKVLTVKSVKPRYIAIQRSQLIWWKGRIGDYSLANITPALIAECRDELLSGKWGRKSPATVNRYLAALSHVLSTAVKEWSWLDHNPIQRVRKPKEPRGRVRFLTTEELNRLIGWCKKERRKPIYLIVVLAISTGARKTELLTLKWRDVDIRRGYIIVQETKNGERRPLFLSGLSLGLMAAYSRLRKRNGFVFPSADRTKHVNINREWKRVITKARLQDFRFHDLRHTSASYLAMNGASIAEIAEVLGHKTLNMVKRYAHLSKTHTANVVANMNAQVFGQLDESNIAG